jgi:rhamnosyltransferase
MRDICFVAVVVTYNCDIEKFLESIDSYKNLVSAVIICDNSTNNKIRDYFSSCQTDQMEYHSMEGNKGIAYALNCGFKIAAQRQADWVLTMDQDSNFKTNIDGYLKICNNQRWDKVSVLSPVYLYQDKGNENDIRNKVVHVIDKTIQSGCAYRLSDFQEIGPFLEEFFIDYVDYEYCLRLRKFNRLLLCVPSVILAHNRGTVIEKNLFFFRIKIAESVPIRHYYQTRNFIKYFVLYHDISELFDRCYLFLRMLVFEKNKLLKVRYTCMGVRDFFFNKWGSINN